MKIKHLKMGILLDLLNKNMDLLNKNIIPYYIKDIKVL